MIDLQLEGRAAIVTGASRGLGRAIALTLAEQGVSVLALARSTESLESLRDEAPGQRVIPYAMDIGELDAIPSVVETAHELLGGLDIVVNNAGIAPAGPSLESDPKVWERVFRVNVFAPVELARQAAKHFVEQGSGKIVNVASTVGLRGKPIVAAYSASKGAMIRMTESLAAEWARHGIQVNAIAPGAFVTEAQQAVLDDPETLEKRLRKIPQRRMAAAEEIGPLAAYLASPLSDFVTGATFVIDGGEVAKL